MELTLNAGSTWLSTSDYRDHMYMFPHGRSLTVEQLHVLRADLTYHSFGEYFEDKYVNVKS